MSYPRYAKYLFVHLFFPLFTATGFKVNAKLVNSMDDEKVKGNISLPFELKFYDEEFKASKEGELVRWFSIARTDGG